MAYHFPIWEVLTFSSVTGQLLSSQHPFSQRLFVNSCFHQVFVLILNNSSYYLARPWIKFNALSFSWRRNDVGIDLIIICHPLPMPLILVAPHIVQERDRGIVQLRLTLAYSNQSTLVMQQAIWLACLRPNVGPPKP